MKKFKGFVAAVVVLILAVASPALAQDEQVQLDIAGYLCGF